MEREGLRAKCAQPRVVFCAYILLLHVIHQAIIVQGRIEFMLSHNNS